MSLRIGANITNLFNQTRINQPQDIDRTSRIDKAGQDQVAEQQDQRSTAGQYVSQDHGGVVQTRVADANNFKKAQLEGNRAEVESLADKLYSKLPNILEDMKLVPGGEGEQGVAATKVSVNERNAAAVADKQAGQGQEQLENFTL